jgi:hypothetical protein
MAKDPTINALETYRSAIAELDPRGENDTVTLALLIGSIIVERVEKRKKPPSADELFALAEAEFRKTNGREPVWR